MVFEAKGAKNGLYFPSIERVLGHKYQLSDQVVISNVPEFPKFMRVIYDTVTVGRYVIVSVIARGYLVPFYVTRFVNVGVLTGTCLWLSSNKIIITVVSYHKM